VLRLFDVSSNTLCPRSLKSALSEHYKKLSCRRHAERCFVSLNILLSRAVFARGSGGWTPHTKWLTPLMRSKRRHRGGSASIPLVTPLRRLSVSSAEQFIIVIGLLGVVLPSETLTPQLKFDKYSPAAKSLKVIRNDTVE